MRTLLANWKLLFLLDGVGGVVTATMIGLVLARIQTSIGLPLHVLHALAIVGLFYAAFSLLHAAGLLRPSSRRLRFIAAANALYCAATAGLLIVYRDEVRALGVVYFAVEIAIIVVLAALELRASRLGA